MSNITLPRAEAEQIRDALASGEKLFAALAALDAALAEPDAKRKPATMKQIISAHRTTIGAPWLDEFDRAWKAAERFHGIKKEDK